MEGKRDVQDYLGKHFNKRWIKEGLEVIHRSEIKAKEPHVMIVDKILKSQVKLKHDPENQEKATRILGVRTHWFRNGEFKEGTFHTKELVPFDVYKDGGFMLKEWLDQQ